MTKHLWKLILCFFVWIALTSVGSSFQGASVNVGDEAPEFELSDATGRIHKLSDFRGKSAVVLEFFRSGDW